MQLCSRVRQVQSLRTSIEQNISSVNMKDVLLCEVSFLNEIQQVGKEIMKWQRKKKFLFRER